MLVSRGARNRFLKASSGLAIILIATASHVAVVAAQDVAQDAALDASGANSSAGVTLDTITVQNNSATAGDITATPGPVSHISRETMDNFGGSKLDNVLRAKPGVFTLSNASNPGVAVNIRGLEGSGRVNMMIDGAPQSFRTTAHDAQGYAYIDENLLSSIDINRGAVTTEGGSGLAGSVNFRTLGVDDIIMDGNDKGVLGRASWGSNGVGFSEMLAGAARVDAIGIAAAISHRDSSNFKNGDGDTVEATGQELTSGLFKTEFGFGEDHKLVLGGVLYNNKYGTWQNGYIPGTFTTYDLFLQNRTFTANYSYNPSGNDLIDLNSTLYYNSTRLNYVGGNGSTVGRQIANDSIGGSLANTSHFTFGEVSLDWKYGFEYNQDNTGGVKVGVNPIDSDATRGAVFTEAQWRYNDLLVLTGLRYDTFKLENSDENIKNDDGRFNPKVTVAYNVTDWLQPYVTYSHSMRAPSLQETMLGGVAHSGTGMMHGNPNLLPELQRGWELGVNVKRDGLLTAEDSLQLKANYYTMRVENYITAAADFSQFVNVDGTSSVKGFELEANYDAGFAFGGIAYTHAKSNLPEQVAGLGANQYLPEDIVTVTAGARFLERKLETGLRVQHVSSGKTLDGVNSKPYELVDLFARYRFTENVDLTFKVNNLLDKSYTPALSTYGSGQGRTFIVASQFQF